MNDLVKLVKNSGFERTNISLSRPLVIHCVPGAGKSTLIREFLHICSEAKAFTFGVEDHPNLSGRVIRKYFRGCVDPNFFNVLDEYLSGDFTEHFDALLSDPTQNKGFGLEAHFICSTTKRFGFNTCILLRTLDFPIFAVKADEVITEHIYEGTIEGEVLAFEPEVVDFVRGHGYKVSCPCDVRGRTFEVCTFVTAHSDLRQLPREDLLICLTRHTRKLRILKQNVA